MANTDFIVKNGLQVNGGTWVVNSTAFYYQGTQFANSSFFSATANSALTANNALNLGGTAAASYQLNSTLSANVATLTANNANNLGGVASANYYRSGGTDVPITDGGTGASDAATARTNLGLAIGTNVQAYDPTLQSLSSLGTAAGRFAYTTGVDTWAESAITAAGRAILDDADATAQRTTLGVPATTDILGQQTIWVPAVAMYGRTTNGAVPGTVETTTNKVMLKTLDFDTTTQEYAQFAIQMPKSWNEGTLVCQFLWTHGAAATNYGVVWQIQAAGFADLDATDGLAFGTAVSVADTGGTTNSLYITAETSELTVAGTPTAEEWIVFQITRNNIDVSDTLAVDAKLIGVKIHYTIDAAKDD